jgi:peptidoglycan/LPS O-acetylase OafA/YrhL
MFSRSEDTRADALPAHSIGLFDGVRGLLAVWVFMSHVVGLNGVSGGVLGRGGIAVDLFMLVSGFLIVWNVELRAPKEPVDSARTWGKFYLRRLFRIAPLYYVAFLIAFFWRNELEAAILQAHTLGGQSSYRPFARCGDDGVAHLLTHLSFTFGLFPCYSSSDFLPDWSLTLEVQFYALFPLLYFALVKWPRVVFAVVSVAVVAGAARLIGVYDVTPDKLVSFPQPSLLVLRLNCFATGMIMALLYFRAHWRLQDWIALALVMFLWQRSTYSAIAFVLCAALFVTRYGLARPALRRAAAGLSTLLSRQPLKWAGDVSYGLYLLHLFVLVPVVNLLWSQAWFAQSGPVVRVLVTVVAALPPAFALAGVAHRLIEQPLINVGRDVTRRIGR